MENKTKLFNIISLNKIKQNENEFFIASVEVNFIKDIYTISPAEYILNSIKDDNFDNDDEIFKSLLNSRMDGYQRLRENPEKIKSIENYLKENDNKKTGQLNFDLFEDHEDFKKLKEKKFNIIPNAILFALQAEEVTETSLQERIDSNSIEDKIYILNDSEILIPKTLCENAKNAQLPIEIENPYKKVFVIDGHHRLMGIKGYVEKAGIEEFQVPGTFIINKTQEVEAEIFTTVNYTVKKVDRSYYYQVVGEFNIGKDEHVFLHFIARYFNEVEETPYYSRIKMLGKNNNKNPNKQTLSQSHFIQDCYKFLFGEKGYTTTKDLYTQEELLRLRLPVLRYFYINKQRTIIIQLLKSYFNTIKTVYNNNQKNGLFNDNTPWENDNQNLFLKTLGFSVLIECFPLIYIYIVHKNNCLTYQENIFSEEMFTPIISQLFTEDYNIVTSYISKYKGASSRGLVTKFTKEVKEQYFNFISKDLQGNEPDSKEKILSTMFNKYIKWYNLEVAGKIID